MKDQYKSKLAEKLLQESNEKYRHLVENASAGIYEIDLVNMRFTGVNEMMCRYLGYTKEELLSMGPFDILVDESKKCFSERLSKVLAGEEVPENTEYRVRGKNGREFWVYVNARFKYEKGVPVVVSGIVSDISQRKRAEEALRNSERFLTNIFESIQDYLSITDTEFNIVRVNKKVEQQYAHSMPINGKKCHKVFHGLDEVCPGCPSRVTLKTGKSAHAVITTSDDDGNVISWEDHYCYPLVDDKTGRIQGVIVYARDITDKVKTKKEMARLDRLNLVGEMAASIGHEIRNPMTAVRGFLQMLTGKEECQKYKRYFEIMIDELDRANAIITEFLCLARNKPVELKSQNLNSIIMAIMPLIEASAISRRMDVNLDLGNVPDLLINEKDIRQLIHNLVGNGLEAMLPGQELTVSTYTDGEYVVLSVKDQGSGMEPGLTEKIGTPFFTTKENGTGLGLAVCYGIANRHNASVNFETGPGGTTFYVRFGCEN